MTAFRTRFGSNSNRILTGIISDRATLCKLQKENNHALNRRISSDSELWPITWLALLTLAVIGLALGNLGLGPWAYTLCLLLLACFLLVPAFGFFVDRNIAIRLFNSVLGNALSAVEWTALPPIRRSVIFFCILLCLTNGLLLLSLALFRLVS